MRMTTRRTIVVLCAVLVTSFLFTHQSSLSHGSISGWSFAAGRETVSPAQAARKSQIQDAFQHAWDGYTKYCFGRDTLHPVSHGCEDDFGGWGATAIDSLTTAIIFEKEDVVIQILDFVTELDFHHLHKGTRIQVFEVIIRHLGAMISAWDLLHGPFSHLAADPTPRKKLSSQMVILADVLAFAFNTPSGLPRDWVDPATGQTDDGTLGTLAGAGTVILEFARMSAITGNQSYVQIAQRAEEHLLQPKPAQKEAFPGLLGSFLQLSNGQFNDDRGSWGAMADSFYEYLIKAYVYNSKVYGHYLERWLLAADSTIRSIGSHPYGHPEWTLLSTWSGHSTHNSMDSLSWFAGGNFILGGMVTKNQTLIDFGLSIADTAAAVYNMTKTGLGGEVVEWSSECEDTNNCDASTSVRIIDTKFRLRPEVLETWYYAYRATRHPRYREWSWQAFEAINHYCRTDAGFSAISNVDTDDGGPKIDSQETFVFAEVLKYIYLIQLEDKNVPFHVQDSRAGIGNTWVFNTEAHPFLIEGSPV